MTTNCELALALTPSIFPVIILEDMQDAAAHLKHELNRQQVRTRECTSIQELIAVAKELRAAMFAVDLDMGDGRSEEGLQAIEVLRAMTDIPDNDKYFYIVALTSYADLERAAIEKGAHSFIVKDTARTDALELLIRLSDHTIEIERQWAQPIQNELTTREYENLVRKLDAAIESGAPLRPCALTVRKALNWPFLLPDDQLVLSTIDEQLRIAMREGYLDKDALRLCKEGVEIIVADNRSDTKIGEWMQRVRITSPDSMFSWLDAYDPDSNHGE